MTMPWPRLLENARDLLRNMLTPPSPHESDPWTRHEANVAIHECLSRRRPPIPNEIVLQILDHPSRWIRTQINTRVATDGEPIRVSSSLQNCGEQQILATNPLSQPEVPRIRSVVYTFTSRDQGWSSFPTQHDTYEGSFTWFEASLTRPLAPDLVESERQDLLQLKATKERTRYELQRNRHAGRHPETYRHELGTDHRLLQHAEEGDSVVLWARASFPGWENRLFNAGIEVWCVDDLTGRMHSTAR